MEDLEHIAIERLKTASEMSLRYYGQPLAIKERIVRFCRDWNISVPENETVFWCAVHKAIVNINSATEDQKRRSYEWLIEHGFSPDIS